MPEFKTDFSPIALFTYNRLDELKQTIANLQRADLSDQSILYVFSDGSKSDDDKASVEAVRNFLRKVIGFKKLILKFSTGNNGLAASIIDGVTKVLKKHGRVIVLEDDLLTSDNFLVFMNKALDYYESNRSILSICGYNMTIDQQKSEQYPYDMFFGKRSSSWGWATWLDKWEDIDWAVNDFSSFSKDKRKKRKFNEWGSDMYGMLKEQQMGKINSWAIRYSYHQYKHDLWSVFPLVAKVKNIGFNDTATHTTQKYNRFEVDLDTSSQTDFKFMEKVALNRSIMNQFKEVNSIKNRIKYKFKNLLPF